MVLDGGSDHQDSQAVGIRLLHMYFALRSDRVKFRHPRHDVGPDAKSNGPSIRQSKSSETFHRFSNVADLGNATSFSAVSSEMLRCWPLRRRTEDYGINIV
ncbi:hypothetical protein E4U42_007266 [Claviceps africana]|uniref:Uncharacterized protein n=1 Tax=Claviceps africana TaxID=83212 RepID=A0A8K0J1Y6_9HYPO|nr:hypothetical protein E4U42_007266 [Claviceps africana]